MQQQQQQDAAAALATKETRLARAKQLLTHSRGAQHMQQNQLQQLQQLFNETL